MIALVALIAMTGLILDGGAVLAQQRVAQNGADGAANAGTVVIASNLGSPGLNDGSDVWTAINDTAADNGLESWSAIYTDVYGQPIGANVVNTGPIPSDARGVRVAGARTASTSFARVLGINSLQANADATVIAGAASLDCVLAEDGCTLLPLTFPVQVSQCDTHGELIEGPWIGAPPPDPENVGDEYWPIVGAATYPRRRIPTATQTQWHCCLCARVFGRLWRVWMAGLGQHPKPPGRDRGPPDGAGRHSRLVPDAAWQP